MNLVCVSVSVCMFVNVFHQKSQLYEMLAQVVIWANVKHDEARLLKLRILGAFLCLLKLCILLLVMGRVSIHRIGQSLRIDQWFFS